MEISHPVQRPKLKLVIRRTDRPLVEPARQCILCEQIKEAYQFVTMQDAARSPICFVCHRDDRRRSCKVLPWDANVRWADRVTFDDASLVIHLIDIEIKNVRRTAVAR